uniref:tyrosine-type recombinase/integrase n=1 Tax=Gordonia sp. B7-2 TaxID=3420932 RepID=UPI003D8A116C
MAWATKLPSKRWRGMYRDDLGKQHSIGTFSTKASALYAADIAEKKARNDPDSLGTLTFNEFLPTWRAQRIVQPSTAKQDESKLDNRVVPRWGEVLLKDITRPGVQEWVAEMRRDKLAASTIQKHVNLVSSVMALALDKGMLPAGPRGEAAVNPCKGVTVPKPDPSPERFLTHDEADAVRGVLEGFDRFIFDLLVGTGMRWGEAVALTWDRVDLAQGTVEVAIAYDRADKSLKATKSHAKRIVPVGETLAKALADRLGVVGFGEPPNLPCVKVPKPRSGLVVANAAGLPYDAALFAKRLDAAGRAATVKVGEQERKVGHVRVHDLRHTYASWLVQRGVAVQQVQRLLGHGSIATTERYARLSDSGWDAVRDALG